MKDILKRLRERAGLPVREAAEHIGVTRATVYAWEAGEKQPDPPALRAAMDLYSASVEERDEVARLRAFGPDPTDDAPPAEAGA